MTSILQCPVCRCLLFASAGGFQCANKHTFDAARQGYVNFLLAHKKHSKQPGDSPEMIRSRRRFLELGLYNKISDAVNDAIALNLPASGHGSGLNILDAGCGEGFYLKRLKDSLAVTLGKSAKVDYYGIDISKFGVRHATQRDKSMHWFVASIVDLPFASSSLDIVLNVFSLADIAEFSRVLREAGRLVVVTPGPKHLNGLREIIYPIAREHAQSAIPEQAKGFFSSVRTTRVNYPLEMTSSEQIMDLLAMTPYFWNIDLNTKLKVEALDRLALEVDVMISVLSKTAG